MVTTLRGASVLFRASLLIKLTGRYEIGGRDPLFLKILGQGAQFLEWAILKAKPGIGEEIAAVLTKK